MKKLKITGVLYIIWTICFFMACTTTRTSNRKEEPEKIAADNQNNAKVQYDLGNFFGKKCYYT